VSALYFSEYLREFRSKGRIVLDSPVIVRHGDGEDDDEGVTTINSSEPIRPSLLNDKELDTRTLGLVFPVVKRPGNAFAYISVGRTPNVDVQLPLIQVSKFHAYFSRSTGGLYTLADGGSKNGTRIGSRELEVRIPVALKNGDRIFFGPYQFTFFLSPGFIDLVASSSRPSY